MLQPLAFRQDPSTWSSTSELQETLRLLKRALARSSPVRIPVKAGEGWVFVDLRKVTHFEVAQEVVYLWSGERLRTSWTTLAEVEAAFPEEDLLRIQRHILLRPEAVLAMRMTWGGRAEVRVAGSMDLEVTRGAAPRLKEHLGLA